MKIKKYYSSNFLNKKKRKILNRPEQTLQKNCVEWFHIVYPHKRIIHIPNGGKRNFLEAVQLKKMGVSPGVYDLFIPHPKKGYHGFWIEMKSDVGVLSDNQKVFKFDMDKEGYLTKECKNFEDFQIIVKDYLND